MPLVLAARALFGRLVVCAALLASAVPSRALAATPSPTTSALERLRELGKNGSWAAAESLAIRTLTDLESSATADSLAIAEVSTLLGEILLAENETDAARAHLVRADQLIVATRGPDAAERIAVLDQLATLERSEGDIAAAIDRRRAAIRIMETASVGDALALANARADLGLLLMYFGDWEGARDAYLAVLPFFEAHYGAAHDRMISLQSRLAIAIGALGDHDGALRWLRECETELVRRPGPPDTALAIALRWQAEMHVLRGEYAIARDLCERAITTARAARRPWGEAIIAPHYLLISVLERIGPRAALDSVATALPQVAAEWGMTSPVTRTNVNYWFARAARRLGRDDVAWDHALRAEQIARERVVLQTRQLPDRRALELADRQARNLDLVLELSATSSDRAEIAWDRLVRVRGAVRAEMTRRRLPRKLLDDPEVAAAQQEWIGAQTELARQRVQVLGTDLDDAARAALRASEEASEEAERVMRSLLAGRHDPGPGADLGLADVFERLAPDEALVGFVEVDANTDSARVLVFVRDAARARTHRLELGSTAALRTDIDPWRESLAALPGATESEQTAAESLARARGERVLARVWSPVRALCPRARTVMIVGEGPLVDLPWHALPIAGGRYLVEEDPLVITLEAEREVLADDRIAPGTSLLAVGAPDFDASLENAAAPLAATVALRGPAFPCPEGAPFVFAALPETAVEASDAARTWDERWAPGSARLLVGTDADEASVRRHAPGKAVLHLATHGYVGTDSCATGDTHAPSKDTRGVGGVSVVGASTQAPPRAESAREPSPWSARRVWLVLAGANHAAQAADAATDGLLSAEEVVTLDLRDTRWVVLSACHSGRAESFTREGGTGLRRAFRLAGASTVIASQWALDDRAAREWMAAFYTAATLDGAGAARAFTQACQDDLARRRASGRTTHPFYWAGFSVLGR